MAKMKKPNLKKALKKVDSLPDKVFGKIDVDLSTLPCLNKVSKEKITANFDSDVLEAVRAVAEEYQISYSTLINDVLRKVFVEDKKFG
ncbi:MAG: BrnA antitoxin family protein [Bacteriovoracaceae bacterium]|nr:BrnA antitoxin family protein [Bacteriovoracaceae bacterium]